MFFGHKASFGHEAKRIWDVGAGIHEVSVTRNGGGRVNKWSCFAPIRGLTRREGLYWLQPPENTKCESTMRAVSADTDR